MVKTSRNRRRRNKKTWRNRQRGGADPADKTAESTSDSSASKSEEPPKKGNIFTRTLSRVSKAASDAGASMSSFLSNAQNKGKEPEDSPSSPLEQQEAKDEAESKKNGSFFSLPSFITGSTPDKSIKDDIKSLIERLEQEKDQLIHNREENEEAIRSLIMAIIRALKDLEVSNKEIQDKLNSIKMEQQEAIGEKNKDAAATPEGEKTADAAAAGETAAEVVSERSPESDSSKSSNGSSDTSSESESTDSAMNFNLPTPPNVAAAAAAPSLFNEGSPPEPPAAEKQTLASPDQLYSPALPSPPAAGTEGQAGEFGSPAGTEGQAGAFGSPAGTEGQAGAFGSPAAGPAENQPVTLGTPPSPALFSPSPLPQAKPPGTSFGGHKRRTRRRRSRRSSRR
jgi:hypothetical protein